MGLESIDGGRGQTESESPVNRESAATFSASDDPKELAKCGALYCI